MSKSDRDLDLGQSSDQKELGSSSKRPAVCDSSWVLKVMQASRISLLATVS